MIRKNLSIIIIAVLAFAAVVYLLFFKGQGLNPGSEGLSRFKVETVRAGNGWGYLIRQDTTPVIEQKVIPGVSGNSGFRTEQQAARTGALVKDKLDRGIFPPTVTTTELDSLGIQY